MNSNANHLKDLKVGVLALTLGLAAFAPAQSGTAAPDEEPERKNESPLARSMGITQRLGETVPKDVKFRDEDGKTIQFGDLLQGRPIVLIPIFYACRTGCPLVTDSVMKTLAKSNKAQDILVPGRDIDVVLLSIHPKETAELARAKKNLILNALTPPTPPAGWRDQAEKGWHLLTGSQESIQKVTKAIGFKYKYDPVKDLINHPTCTVILTPTGKISSYTIGNAFPTVVAKEDLGTAARDGVGERADQSMMFGCIMLDPATGKYRVVVQNVLRFAGVLTVLVLITSIVSMSIKSKREERQHDLDRARTHDQ